MNNYIILNLTLLISEFLILIIERIILQQAYNELNDVNE